MALTSPLRLLAVLVVAACSSASEPSLPDPGSAGTMSAKAAGYIYEVVGVMQANSVRRKVIDWPLLLERTVQRAGSAQTTADTYPAIRQAVTDLGDRHSSFWLPGSFSTEAEVILPPRGVRLADGKVGYLTVPQFSNSDGSATELATMYHQVIAVTDTASLCGWMIDLRGNLGGNMWPMLAGVGPILGGGIVGYFVDPDSAISAWYYHEGASGITGRTGPVPGTVITQVTGKPYVSPTGSLPVAVLTDERTASSGEAIVVAFRGRPMTRSFGKGTYGVSTANRLFVLSDGAGLNLTVSTFADRTGTLYGETIQPDEVITGPEDRAVEWLVDQPACTAN